MIATIKAWNAWSAIYADQTSLGKAAVLLRFARTAVGNNTLEEKLIRLMVWVGATLQHNLLPAEGENPASILAQRTGWCDQQCKVFGFISQHMLAVPVRLVHATHTDGANGHVMVEVSYAGSWHLFDVDPNHQVAYRDPDTGKIMSWEELHNNLQVVKSIVHWWRSPINNVGREGFFDTADYHSMEWIWPWQIKPQLPL
jgi:hypothetical protein